MKITLLTGKTFDISEAVGMDIKIITSRMGRKLSLHIDAKERRPVLSVPRFCSRKQAIKFVNENMDWIINNLGRLPAVQYFADGEKVDVTVTSGNTDIDDAQVVTSYRLRCLDLSFLYLEEAALDYPRIHRYTACRDGDDTCIRSVCLTEDKSRDRDHENDHYHLRQRS